jgi:1,4-dihydroxy-2-naphthoate polyprenyltransferase
MKIKDWIQAARPKTLGAAVAPVIVGCAVGVRFGAEPLHGWLLLCTLLSCMGLQVATNWFNDALDFKQGKDTAARLGPRRVTASGLVSPGQVMGMAWLTLAVATLVALPLIQARGWPIIAIGVPSLYFCYGYTGGPVPLAYRGLGELFVILFFGWVAVTGAAFVQSSQWLEQGLWAGLQVGCLSTVLIAVNNLRDYAEDITTGKRTLAVRLGLTFAKVEVTLLALGPFVFGIYWLGQGVGKAFYLPLFSLPLAGVIVMKVWTVKGAGLNAVLAMGGVLLLLFSGLMVYALLP